MTGFSASQSVPGVPVCVSGVRAVCSGSVSGVAGLSRGAAGCPGALPAARARGRRQLLIVLFGPCPGRVRHGLCRRKDDRCRSEVRSGLLSENGPFRAGLRQAPSWRPPKPSLRKNVEPAENGEPIDPLGCERSKRCPPFSDPFSCRFPSPEQKPSSYTIL